MIGERKKRKGQGGEGRETAELLRREKPRAWSFLSLRSQERQGWEETVCGKSWKSPFPPASVGWPCVHLVDATQGKNLLPCCRTRPQWDKDSDRNRVAEGSTDPSQPPQLSAQNLHCVWNHKHGILTVLAKVKLICSFDFHQWNVLSPTSVCSFNKLI